MYKVSECKALLDGGSICLDLIDDEGNRQLVKLDKEMGSPTEGKVFATMLNRDRPLSKDEEGVLLEILSNTRADTENHKWHLKMVTDHLAGVSPQTSEMLSDGDIDDLLQDI